MNSKTQIQTILYYLQNNTATASMVSNETGIPQKCITRYKRDLEKSGLLYEVERKNCKLTGFKAWFLTANPCNFPRINLKSIREKREKSNHDLFLESKLKNQ